MAQRAGRAMTDTDLTNVRRLMLGVALISTMPETSSR